MNTNDMIIFHNAIKFFISNVILLLQKMKDSDCIRNSHWTSNRLDVPANSMHPVSISANMQPAAHMSMALV